jgi:hypothetical protein
MLLTQMLTWQLKLFKASPTHRNDPKYGLYPTISKEISLSRTMMEHIMNRSWFFKSVHPTIVENITYK